MELLFVNIHHLLNEHRPVQAREKLQEMLREQQARRAAAADALDKAVAEAQQIARTL